MLYFVAHEMLNVRRKRIVHFLQPPRKGFRHEPEASAFAPRSWLLHAPRCSREPRWPRPRRPRRHPPPPPRRRPNPTGRSPATSASTASTCSAASRRPTKSPRSRAASTWATRAASTSAPGRRTSAGSPTATRTSRRSLEWDFYGGYKWALPADFVLDLGVLYYWYPGTYPRGYTKPNTTELYAALDVEVAVGEVQLQRQQQDLRLPRFARLATTGSCNVNYDVIDKVNDVHRQGHALRSRRQAEVQEQRLLRLQRLEGRRRRPKSTA